MPRHKRSYLPGVPFHITARLNDKQHLFTPDLRDAVVACMDRALLRSDAILIAYAIMSNHFHLVVQHGLRPLAALMQPLCRNVALLTQKAHSRTGHIFGCEYFDKPCFNPDYLRACIVYTHLNPLRAGACQTLEEYRWTSRTCYLSPGSVGQSAVSRMTPMVELFERAMSGKTAAIRSYLEFENYHATTAPEPRAFHFLSGDRFWFENFKHDAARKSRADDRPDLRDLARRAAAAAEPPVPLELLRSGCRLKVVVALRKELVAHAARLGYRGCDIAKFFNISETSVSRICVAEMSARWHSDS